ncbi:hypothetical protein [Chryseobacterium sp. CT-SW4]|uniref:hypothetical protein n=1 Tax=Chryseobacterium sp. SW-1 TaxID=3157343 RepID=UPI003B02A0B4
MRKKIIPWLFPVAISLFTFHSCSSEDDYFKSQDEKYTSNKFQVFSEQNGRTVDYADGFKTLMERYDSLYSVSYTAKTMKRSFSKSETISDGYIEFNIRSQEFTTDNKEKYVLFPLIKNYQVSGIMVASLREDETIVEYYEMSQDEKNYQEILNLFKAQYVKTAVNKRLSKSACGFDGYPPCDIDTVIITVPKTGGNGNGLPSGGSGGTSGGCSIYENCIDNNLGGGGGGAPELNLNPCMVMKIRTGNSTFKDNITALENKTGDSYESGFRISNTGENQILQNAPGSSTVNMSVFPNTIALMHSHYDGLYPIFSPGDIMFFNQWIVWAQEYNNNPSTNPKIPINELVFTIVTSWGNYSFTFDGSSATAFPNYTEAQLKKVNDNYMYDYLDNAKSVGNVSGNVSYDMGKLEKEFLKFMGKHLNIPNAKLFRNSSSGNTQLSLVNGKITESKCP